jgi:hypothetical protein
MNAAEIAAATLSLPGSPRLNSLLAGFNSLLGRFNSQFDRFNSLFDRFNSLFGRSGNLRSARLKKQ